MTYLRYLLAEAMGLRSDDPKVLAAERAINPIVDESRVKRVQILADRETDWRILARRYHVGRTFIYKTWSERSNSAHADKTGPIMVMPGDARGTKPKP